MSSEYVFFWNGSFSQWQSCQIKYDGHAFNCAEQAMMYAKAMLFEDMETANRILAAVDPGKQKALGRSVVGFNQATWDEHKTDIVFAINYAKFAQNKGLRRKLFQTGAAPLAEASPMDVVWGIGLDEAAARETKPENWPGQNLLGRILMRVRTALEHEFSEDAEAVHQSL